MTETIAASILHHSASLNQVTVGQKATTKSQAINQSTVSSKAEQSSVFVNQTSVGKKAEQSSSALNQKTVTGKKSPIEQSHADLDSSRYQFMASSKQIKSHSTLPGSLIDVKI